MEHKAQKWGMTVLQATEMEQLLKEPLIDIPDEFPFVHPKISEDQFRQIKKNISSFKLEFENAKSIIKYWSENRITVLPPDSSNNSTSNSTLTDPAHSKIDTGLELPHPSSSH